MADDKMKKFPISGLQTGFRTKMGMVNMPNKRPNMTNYTPGERTPKEPYVDRPNIYDVMFQGGRTLSQREAERKKSASDKER